MIKIYVRSSSPALLGSSFQCDLRTSCFSCPPTTAGFFPLFCPLSFLCETAKGWTTSPLPEEPGITRTPFFMPLFPFLVKLVSQGVALLCWALFILAEEVGTCFWNTTDAAGGSDVMARPNWADSVLLNINFAHLCNSPSVSQVLTMTLLQSRWLVTILPSACQVLLPPCSPSPPPHTFHCLPLLQVPRQLSHHLGPLAVRSLKASLMQHVT